VGAGCEAVERTSSDPRQTGSAHPDWGMLAYHEADDREAAR
jgi:hypothetical protein